MKINNNLYKVIDGQQRLTTIYIILKVFKDYLEESKNRYRFEINYERDSKELLENIDNINCKNSLDCCYMKEAYNAVFEWIETNSISFQDIEEFRLLIVKNSRISNNKDINKNIRFIWYEIDEKDEFDVFIRLNIGKIPLTNTELIKSFLIQKETDSQKRFEFSKEWDEIEYILESDELFGFLSPIDFSNRMEIIFQILLNKTKYKDYELYENFYEKYKNENLSNIWNEVRKIFYMFKFWHEDRYFYHLIGFLTSTGININEIYKIYMISKNKIDFKQKLINKIKNILDINIDEIDILSYYDKDKVHKVLLLFNILTLITSNKDIYIKFSFDKFNKEKWSIEHIVPQTEKIQEKDFKKIKEELNILGYKIEDDITFEDFKKKHENKFIDEYFKDSEKKNNIINLTLLPQKLNSAIKNNFFSVKRNYIIQKDKIGEFVPIATKNLFLKYYSGLKNNNLDKWSEKDGSSYVNEIKRLFENFFKGIENE